MKAGIAIPAFALLLFSGCHFDAREVKDNTIRNKNKVRVEVGDAYQVEAEVAKTMLERAQGLSHRDFLAPDEAMLFVFDKPDYYQFWMKDMNFPIDIIFINDNKIVDIKRNVPVPDIDGNYERYPPTEPAQYVLEVPAGLSEEYKFNIGTPVEMELTFQ